MHAPRCWGCTNPAVTIFGAAVFAGPNAGLPLPLSDTERCTLLNRLDDERRSLAYAGQVTEITPLVTRMRSVDGAWHNVTSPSLTVELAEATIAAEVEYHRQRNASFEWKCYFHDRLADLPQRLERHGFVIGPLEAVLVYDLTRPLIAGSNARVSVRRVETAADVVTYSRVSSMVFGRSFTFEAELGDSVRTGSTQIRGYIACADGEPVSMGRLYTHPDSWFGGLYGGGTIAAHRGRGFYRALVAARATDAFDSGARYLLVDALPTSRPILERLGFQHLTDTWACEWKPHE